MLPDQRLESLKRKHEAINTLIESEEKHHAVTRHDYIRQLKRQKLLIKDALEGLSDEQENYRSVS